MPTQLKDFSSRQEALTVFMDYRSVEEQNPLHQMIMEQFKPMQVLYLSGSMCDETGVQLYQYIRQKVQNYEAAKPTDRLVFCHYLRLNDLTEEWIAAWQNRVSTFQERLSVANAFDQFHVVCLSYESSEYPLGEQSGKIAGLLKRLTEELTDIAHVTYLLYTNGFETLTRQEQGLVQLLYLLSRENITGVLNDPMQNRTWIKMLNYSDYSEKMAELWSGRIRDLHQWMLEEGDPGRLYFLDAVRVPLQHLAQELSDAEMEFDSRVDIYPVHIEDFKKTGFLPNSLHTSTIGADHAIIQKRKAEYFGELLQNMKANFAHREWEEIIEKKAYYNDLKALREMVNIPAFQDGSLEEKMTTAILNQREGRARDIIRTMIQDICVQIRSRLGRTLDRIEEIRQTKQLEMQQAQKELDVAGRYANLQECFQNIARESMFNPIEGMSPEFQKTICLIGSDCYGKWYAQNYNIAEVAYAQYCQDIDPTDIALLRIGDLIDVKTTTAEQRLTNIL